MLSEKISNSNINQTIQNLARHITVSSGSFREADQKSIETLKSFQRTTGDTIRDSGIFMGFDNGNSDIEKLIQASGLYKPTSEEWYNKFSRFQTMNPWRRLNLTKEYLFFTKPDLIIYAMHDSDDTYLTTEQERSQAKGALHAGNTYTVPFFREMQLHYPYVLQQLQYSYNRKLPFMNLLSNAKRTNLELADIQASADIDSPENIFGTKISYRGTSYSSDDGYDFTIDFEDSKYLEIYRLLKAYDIYENRKHLGLISIPNSYVVNKILHDQFSIYKFIVDEDYSTLVYWAKLTGCYIKSVPRTTFSDLSESGGITYTVNFRCSFIEDMTPEILADFNTVAGIMAGGFDSDNNPTDNTSLLYDSSLGDSNPEWCDYPYILYDDIRTGNIDNNNTNVHTRPKLIWKNKSKKRNTQALFS